MKIILAALAALAIPSCMAAPAAAQSIAGCGTTAIAKADQNNAARLGAKADCFAKAKTIATTAEAVHRARIAALAPAPAPTPNPVTWKLCAAEGQACRFEGAARVRYGAGERWAEKPATASIACDNATFGDPAPYAVKQCQTTAAIVTAVATVPPVVTPPVVTPPVVTPPPVAGGTLISAGVRPWPVPARPTTRRGQLGVNIAGVAWWHDQQTYTNLVYGAEWADSSRGWPAVPRDQIGADGVPLASSVGPGRTPSAILANPTGYRAAPVPVICTWAGTGRLTVGGGAASMVRGDHKLTFAHSGRAWITIEQSEPADPVREIDCRATADVGRTSRYAPETLAYYGQFGILRMLDVNGVNGNGVVRWSTRTLPGDRTVGGSDGMALEDQIGLAREADADAWYNVSWNADEDYQRRMAQLAHDGTPALRHVYVELSNEVWNYAFPVAQQNLREAEAANLAADKYEAALRHYAQRTAALMRIWTDVFKDRPGQLIRVVGAQASNAWSGNVILNVSGLARSGLVDALAIAPYFAHDVLTANPTLTDQDALLDLTQKDADRVVTKDIPAYAGVARTGGVPLIFYEAGQHQMAANDNDPRLAALNRAPRMGDIYRSYIRGALAANDNYPMVLFNATGPISKYGAWGLREYAGQPINETPKLAAAQAFLSGR